MQAQEGTVRVLKLRANSIWAAKTVIATRPSHRPYRLWVAVLSMRINLRAAAALFLTISPIGARTTVLQFSLRKVILKSP
ncbi:hypothetical protein BDV98DRAFT_575281 [Pterulicium gracile]|uniref:Uncharacterized protein n=1 Tax=Pterulicium gracile TaxID=1884261 RepID=A0A5C3Q9D4_9AGAR|nr:hypothetical protein BDV98DRAFT_575281 [Pterula gracilis]